MSDDIDRDAIEILGINPKIWKEYRRMTGDKYVQDDLPYFQQQDDKEAFERHKQAMAQKWFKYYRACKDPQKKMSLIDQYNRIAQMKQR